MSTLYIRDVPDDVTAILKQRAADAGMSLSSFVKEELIRVAQRPTNAQLLDRLHNQERSSRPTRADILEALETSRR